MSESNQKTLKILAQKLDAASSKILMTCSLVILASVLMHDGDHLRQAGDTAGMPQKNLAGREPEPQTGKPN